MWKAISTLCLAAACSSAGAHTLPGDATLARQLTHQLSSTHHLTGVLLLLAAAGFLLLAARAWCRRDR